jgi:RNA polymerase sigma-70 factor (ECF subfamily)
VTAVAATDADHGLLVRLRRGDEAAFTDLVQRYGGLMLRVAATYAPSRAVAEEIVQETWLAVLRQLDRFEERSSLKTWIFQILTKRALTRAARERRSVPFSAVLEPGGEDAGPAVPAERFLDAGHRWAGHWASPPRGWEGLPEERLLSAETGAHLARAIEALPPGQRTVIRLRDVHGWTAAEVCEALGLSQANQRVLLHRARAKVRLALEHYLDAP